MSRSVLPVLAVALLACALAAAGCGGDGDGDSLALADRVLQEGELEGASAGEPREWTDATAFARQYRVVDPAQLARRLTRAGFVAAAANTLNYGGRRGRSAQSAVVQVRSRAAAAELRDWLYENAAAPCPPGCGVRSRSLAVAVPGARALEVSARRATTLGPPFQSYFAAFADGPLLYTMFAFGPPRSIPAEDVVGALGAQHQRVAGRPPPES
jgi:hypothetical protein